MRGVGSPSWTLELRDLSAPLSRQTLRGTEAPGDWQRVLVLGLVRLEPQYLDTALQALSGPCRAEHTAFQEMCCSHTEGGGSPGRGTHPLSLPGLLLEMPLSPWGSQKR